MTGLRFFKYEALGNDFIIIDETDRSIKEQGLQEPSLSLEKRIKLCNRHQGIGADGVITVFHSKVPDTFAYMHITNADGSVPEMCGNGFRCVAKWLADEGRIPKNYEGALLTDDGPKEFKLSGDMCTVEMGTTYFPEAASEHSMRDMAILLPREFALKDEQIKATVVSLGNPHLVLEMNISDAQAEHIGAFLERHPLFPNRTNVEFAMVLSPTKLSLKVWERGVGLTKACGTGACASVAALVKEKKLLSEQEIIVSLAGGDLFVKAYLEKSSPIRKGDRLRIVMKGPANRVFTGFFS